MIFNVNDYVEPSKPRVYISMPNRTIIGELNEAFSISRNTKVGNIPEISFKLPYQISVRNELVDNPNITNVKNRFLVKFVQDNITEWYIIKNPTDTMDESSDYKTIQAYGLAYQLTDKNIRNYKATSINATSALTVALSQTNWTIGNVDASFDLLYREFDISNSNCLDFVFQIATTFDALVDFDSVNKQVNFLIFNNYGTNKGWEISYGNLLKSASKVENTDDFYTRLKVFGKDGISIMGQNSVGANYIEDYSYFLQGYAEDGSGVAISHSTEGMSDSLCKALITYRNLIAASEGTYQGYLTSLSGYQTTLTSQNNVLTTYQTELAVIQDNISLANYNGTSTTTLVSQQIAKQAQIASQNTLIATTQGSINTVNANITTLKNSLSITANFTNPQITEWNDYIIVGTFENSNVSDPKQLLALGTVEFEKLKQPKLIVNISMINFMECVEERARGSLNLGDIITIKNTKIGVNVTAKVIEMNFDYENGDISLVISNVKELLSDESRFLRDLYRANTTSSNVGANIGSWNDAVTGVDEVSQIINNNWQAADRMITASENESVEISRKGILIKDITDPNKLVILQHGIIALSLDKGNTWKTAITPAGITAQRLIGQLILGNTLNITDNNGQLTIVGNLMTIKDAGSITRVLLGEYATGKFGLKLMNKTGTATVLDEDGILQTDTIQLADNVDATHSLKLKFYIDTGVINIRAVKLNFSLEPFRAYSTGAASGGGAAVTSSSGGGATPTSSSGGGATPTSSSGGSSSPTSGGGTWFTQAGYSSGFSAMMDAPAHDHGIPSGTLLAKSGGGSVTWVPSGVHSHIIDVNHNHTVTVPNHTHDVSIPSHTHTVTVPNHTHDVSIPAHMHAINYGIFESTSATGVNIKVDGVTRINSGFSTDQSNIDLTTWITTSGWHTVELTSSQLGRINAALYIKNFITT